MLVKDNLSKLWNRMSSGSYFPSAVRRAVIPKTVGSFQSVNMRFVHLMLFVILCIGRSGAQMKVPIINCSSQAGFREKLAAKEIRRYVFLRSGELLPIVEEANKANGSGIVLKVNSSLASQQYRLKTQGRKLTISGGSDVALLYGAYHFIEKLGVRFYLHGDVIPDEKMDFIIPDLDETHTPLFETRGILPFHDFPEGPDWWNAEDYKFYLSQMTKMRMNFIGLHCYPNVPWGPEPTVWMGLSEDVKEDGTVKFSYPASYHTSERLNGYGENSGSKKRWWGYSATPTSQFSAGADQIFEKDNYGPDCMGDHIYRNLTPDTSNDVFNMTGKLYNDIFTYAGKLGVKTAMGTETPLLLPDEVKMHLREKGLKSDDPDTLELIYEGMFKRMSRSFPLDYYWAWTPEGWLSPQSQSEIDKVLNEFRIANQVIDILGNPFTFATCGWVMGPVQKPMLFDQALDKDAPISCITSWLGASRLNSTFSGIKDRPKWAIPWIEDDTAMISPQLWVGRLRRDASDAYAYGCTGLMGIHWRTKILAPNFATLAAAGWQQKWHPTKESQVAKSVEITEGCLGGYVTNFPDKNINGTEQDAIYQSCRYNLNGYRLQIPNGTFTVTMKFCETYYTEPRKRVFDVKVAGNTVAAKLDVFAEVGPLKSYDLVVNDIKVSNGALEIAFDKIVEFPFISAIVIEGKTDDLNQIKGTSFKRKINCGGKAWNDYEADLDPLKSTGTASTGPRDLPCDDFYLDWCRSEFGAQASKQLAGIFLSIDSGGPLEAHSFEGAWPRKMPLPSVWIDGPGGIRVDKSPWEQVKKDYEFVDKMVALRSEIKGKGNLSRFDYWLNSFRFLKTMGRLSCTRGELDKVMEAAKEEADSGRKKKMAEEQGLPLRIKLSRLWEEMMTYQLAASDTPGELGTIANLEQHNRRNLNYLDLHDATLEKLLGRQLPREAAVGNTYRAAPRVIVPSPCSWLNENETLNQKIIILDTGKPGDAAFYWRELGETKYNKISLEHVNRGVYTVRLPSAESDYEYYIRVASHTGKELVFPVTAPEINQTVLVVSDK